MNLFTFERCGCAFGYIIGCCISGGAEKGIGIGLPRPENVEPLFDPGTKGGAETVIDGAYLGRSFG